MIARFAFLLLFGWALAADAQMYSPPASPREDINLNSGWRFIRQDVSGAETNGFDDSAWTLLDLPHTWNNLDGQDGGNNYYRGIGWYRRHCTISTNETGRRLFLKFDGANLVSDVYVNGNFVGEHQGGFAAFAFDVTPFVNVGGDNVIAVKVNNAANSNICPLSGDFTSFGGLYRDVHLLATDPLQVTPLDYGSPGVYLRTTGVSSNSANLQVTAVVSNANAGPVSVTMRAVITDAASNIVATLTNVVTMPAASLSNVIASAVVTNPHLWDGLNDPYLYRAFIEIYNGTNLTDLVSQPLGFRYFSFDPNNGFVLNGRYYDLHGVSMHQDYLNLGWALTDAQRLTNFALLKELGATTVRLAHYQHAEHTYQLADQAGIVVWTEIPLVNSVNTNAAFVANAQQQLRELIRQNYNHPSVMMWGIFNEITLGSGPNPDGVVSNLAALAAQEDPTRPSTSATLHSSTGNPSTWMTQIAGFNQYYGWYADPTDGIGAWADNIHAARPTNCIGVSEYGAGASVWQHSEEPLTKPGQSCVCVHPEEWQDLVHEVNWSLMKTRPFLWGKYVWNMFDFASDGRNEGDTPGRNDKGLVTYDRQIRKDAFYFYKANWTTNPVVYITGHTFSNRQASINAKVYSNCDSVELFLNGISQGSRSSSSNIFLWPVTLAPGCNFVQAIGTKGSTQVVDSLTWATPVSISITSPAASKVFLNSTNDTLWLAASSPGALQASWTQLSGPGVVAFGSSNALSTTARFSANGVYQIQVTANCSTAAVLTVLINPNQTITNGLNAWWKMDETNGTTAADSSGNGRTATLVNAAFASGYLANAYRGTNASSRATYAANDSNQVTVAAWVRCDTTGGGSFPRIVNSPSYRLMFRFASSDVNSVGFATEDGTNGDWDSGAGSISLSNWFHVAVSYDRSGLTNRPAFYINGVKRPTVTLAVPGGAPPALGGTGYIGNRAALDRSWIGLIDDLRIYSRVLGDTEIQTLASLPITNIAPSVNAGTNQTAVVGVPITLAGTASDDGPFTTMWSQLSGPGVASFANPNATNTAVTFNAAGSYMLRLSADDGQAQSVSDVGVTVISVEQSWANRYGAAPDASDPFGTGLSNTNKFLAGFAPSAWPRILGIAITNSTDIAINYIAANGDTSYVGGPATRTNVLEFAVGDFSNDFTTTGLTNVFSGGVGLGTNVTVIDFFGATNFPARFYRVRVVAP